MNRFKKKNRIWLYILCGVLGLGIILLSLGVYYNNALVLSEYEIKNSSVPESFCGFKVAQVSDLHNSTHGKDNKKLLNILREAQPDIIVFTGDMIDSYHTDVEVAVAFVKEAVKIAPCYYVTGNHESRVPEDADYLFGNMIELGVHMLYNMCIELPSPTGNGESILLAGLDDPTFLSEALYMGSASAVDSKLKEILPKNLEEKFTLLLSHRPELFEVYTKNNIDLTLSGHAHGGQFRLPFVGGLYAPHQGFLPQYDSGLYTENDSNMIVSRGIGNSLFPFRLFNKPEVILVELTN